MNFDNPKLFVGRVPVQADEATLIQHFSKYGEVKHALVINGKAIGFVTFSEPLMAKNALQEDHIILGRKVDVKPAKPRVQIGYRKIFVGGLPSSITLEEFKEYFGSYGTITDAVVIYDKESHKFRGYGFVTYDSEEAAETDVLNNKMVEVKRAKPKEKMNKNVYEPGFNHLGESCCYYFYFPVTDGYEPGFASYPLNAHAYSNSWVPGCNWINWRAIPE